MVGRRIVIGIDGGGTTTRAVAVDLSGKVLASALSGGASPSKSPNACENVQRAILEVTAKSGRTLADVAALVAGLAGLDTPKDEIWAEEFTRLSELTCPRLHVNDAVVAHAGALESRPGIIAIAGTGSIVFGVTETGQAVRNYDFHHGPSAQARALSYNVVHSLLAGESIEADAEMTTAIFEFWNVADWKELRELGRQGFVADRFERNQRFGEMAPLVTAAASRNVPLACRECDRIAEALCQGIRLVGGCFGDSLVSVALIGSLIRSTYFQMAIAQRLAMNSSKRYQIEEPVFSGEIGAALMAMQLLAGEVTPQLRAALQAI